MIEALHQVLATMVKCEKHDRDVMSVFGMCVEETGEISTALFRESKSPEPLISESADLIISAMDFSFMVFLRDIEMTVEQFHAMDEAGQRSIFASYQSTMNDLIMKKARKWLMGSLQDKE